MLAEAFTTMREPSNAPSVMGAACLGSSESFANDLPTGTARFLAAREHLFREGDAATHVYLVEAGHVCIYRMMSDGRRQVLDFAYPGDMIGLGSLHEHGVSAQATTRAKIRCLSAAGVHEAARRSPHIGAKLYEALASELSAARELLFTVSQRTATERVASFLVALSRRNERRGEDANEIVLPMTRSDIADFLGLTIETVSRTFTKFRTLGLVGLEQSILVTIKEPAALAQMAEGRMQ